MWQLFPLHNDGLGKKRWVSFPISQQLEGVTSPSVNWLFPSILIYFLSIWQQDRPEPLLTFIFQGNKYY